MLVCAACRRHAGADFVAGVCGLPHPCLDFFFDLFRKLRVFLEHLIDCDVLQPLFKLRQLPAFVATTLSLERTDTF